MKWRENVGVDDVVFVCGEGAAISHMNRHIVYSRESAVKCIELRDTGVNQEIALKYIRGFAPETEIDRQTDRERERNLEKEKKEA